MSRDDAGKAAQEWLDRFDRWESAQPKPREWIEQAIGYFRGLGFFAAYAGLTDAQVADALEARAGKPLQLIEELADQSLLGFDDDRVWADDTEDMLRRGDNYCASTLKQWARISRGAFAPQDVVETWEGEDGPVWISFALAGRRHRLKVADEMMTGFLDMEILTKLNRLIAPTGFRSAAVETYDQTDLVVVLTRDEIRRLQRERGWEFRVT